jgi:hypothetical protein
MPLEIDYNHKYRSAQLERREEDKGSQSKDTFARRASFIISILSLGSSSSSSLQS